MRETINGVTSKIVARATGFAFSIVLLAGTACSTTTVLPGSVSVRQVDDPSNAGLGPDNGYYPMRTADAARPLCPRTLDPHAVRCFAWIRTDLRPLRETADGLPTGVGYTAAEIQSAYRLNPKLGAGQTVFLIEALGYPTLAGDLAHYRSANRLPPCTIASGCLMILNQYGRRAPLPAYGAGWVGEQSLDIDAVSAACPLCRIVVIQALSFDGLRQSLTTAIDLGAKIVSMSYGSSESTVANPGLPMSGHVFVAAAGDFGGGKGYEGGPEVPCMFAAIICAGGTQLTHAGNGWQEKVWNNLAASGCGGPCGATGSGCSTIVPKPSWQTDKGCRMRSGADLSADASPFTPLAVYNSAFKKQGYPSGWAAEAGTSLATPLIAAMFALAGNAATRHAASEIWAHHEAIRNLTAGTNLYAPVTGPCASSVRYICVARKGYSGPTGWGSPIGVSNL
jgi:Subtilase family